MKEIFKIFVLLVMICTFTACAAGGKTSDTKDISIKLESFSDVKKDILSTDTEYENISVPTETLQALANDLPEKAELADLKQVNDREQCFGKIRPLFISDKDYKKEYYQGFDSSIFKVIQNIKQSLAGLYGSTPPQTMNEWYLSML